MVDETARRLPCIRAGNLVFDHDSDQMIGLRGPDGIVSMYTTKHICVFHWILGDS